MDPKARVLELAAEQGFPLARVAPATLMTEARTAALERSRAGDLDGLHWMTPEWLERATDPGSFLEGARSVIICALPYRPASHDPLDDSRSRGRVAAYAAGRDYHRVFEKKLRRLAANIRDEMSAGARATVDYGPLLERPLAALAGMGWLGKSTMLLVPGFGPWVLLGAVATTLELAPDGPLRKTCGSCTRCVVACPTGALGTDGSVLDARLCISYHTIENRGPIPRELRAKFGAWIFGCDDCLEACPVGRQTKASHPDFVPRSLDDTHPPLAELLSLSDEEFAARYRGRPILRAKRDGFLRNVCIALGNAGTPEDLPALKRALSDASPLVRGHAAWAIGRLGERCGIAETAHAMLAHCQSMERDESVQGEIALALTDLGPTLPYESLTPPLPRPQSSGEGAGG